RLDHIPKPESVEWEWWLRMFPGYGFILAADPQQCGEIISMFAAQGITASIVGELTADSLIRVRKDEEEAVLIDWSKEALVGSGRE
ncbi:phosphoribosylformylglycinamidine synthase, partial [Paenibacillus sepulcri]|nr:phosphoribosylformylglycinamidine synthase [Paenibacillus sepulcri]